MSAGCRNSNIDPNETGTITETLEYISNDQQAASKSAAAIIYTETGESTVVYGEISEETDGKLYVEDMKTGERFEIAKTDVLPEIRENVTTTVKTEGGKNIVIEGPAVKNPDGTATVVDRNTGSTYIVETSTLPKETTIAVSSTSTVVTATKETTVKTTEPTTVATTTETTVKQTEPKPTTTKPTTAPTTTVAPTTQPTTAATTVPTTAPTTAATTAAPTPVLPTPSGKNDTATFVAQAFAEVNVMRSEVGASPVVMSPQLVQDFAMLRAKEEADQYAAEGTMDHFRPNGEGALQHLHRLYFDGTLEKGATAENLTRRTDSTGYFGKEYVSGTQMIRGFQQSPNHYKTIIADRAGSVAIGYAYDESSYSHFAVLIFLER
jgi:uncharacterized protein YkwD